MKKFLLQFSIAILFFSRCLSAFASELTLFQEANDPQNTIINLINNAHNTIDIEVYLLNNANVITALLNAHKKGVTIRLILEKNPFGQDPNNNENTQTISKLLDNGNGILEKNIRFGNNNIYNYTHEKAIIIDAKTSYAVAAIMTLNLTEDAFNKNRDYGIVDTNRRDIDEIEYIFNMDFCKSSLALSSNDPKPYCDYYVDFDATDRNPNAKLIWSPSRIIPTNNSREGLLNLIYSATNSIIINGEELNSIDIENALKYLTTKKNVKVKIILPYPSDIYLTKNPNLDIHCVEPNQASGIPYMHAKMIVVDDKKAYVGSVNYSDGSMDLNRELGIIFTDQNIITQLNNQFASDWDIEYKSCNLKRRTENNTLKDLLVGATVVGAVTAGTIAIAHTK